MGSTLKVIEAGVAYEVDGEEVRKGHRDFQRVDAYVRQQNTEAGAEDARAADVARKAKQLAETDWYVIRSIETGAPVPDEVKAQRAQLRNDISDLRAK